MDLFIGLAIAGGILGGWQHNKNQSNFEAEAKAKQDELKKQQQELQRLYEAKKKEDLDAAAFKDQQLTRNEGYLSEGANQAIEALGLSQKSNAYSVQNQQISNSSDTGSALANAATSGIRSGSVMDSIERSDAYAAELLEANRDALYSQTDMAFRQNQLGLMQNLDSITGSRLENNSIRNSYNVGGYNYEKFRSSYDQLSRQINDLDPNKKGNWFNRNKPGFLDGLTSIFTGASTMVNLGSGYKSLKKSYEG